MVGEDDREWISEQRRVDPNGPGGDIGPAIARILAAGANEDDLTKVVRVMQWQLLFGLCYLLDFPYHMRDHFGPVGKEVEDILWGLFQVDENFQPIAEVEALHEFRTGDRADRARDAAKIVLEEHCAMIENIKPADRSRWLTIRLILYGNF